ncbi:hypothetical protein LINGRAPRIM_LOCUS2238 [Linum grandiflorum]
MATQSRLLTGMSKTDPLDGTNFKRWSQMILIFLEQLEVNYSLTTNPLVGVELTTTESSSSLLEIQADKIEKSD